MIEPQLLAYFTDDTYSAIPNKGIHAAYKKLRLAVDTVPEEMTYCLKIDCKKFYPSIDHETLKQKFRRKYKDPELLELIDEVIDSISTCPATDENIEFYRSCGNEIKIVKVNGKDFIEGVGIPIGNYFSQYDGNFFLSGFDHWIKEVKRVKHYYRYMDDICIFARTKEELHQLLAEINEYFIQNLKLRIKGNYQIFPSFIRGIDFVGYRIFLKDTLLRKSTCQEFERKMTAIRKKIESGQEMNYSEWCAINSYKGWLKYCDSSRLSEKYIEPIQPYADRYYKDHIKKGGKSMKEYGKVRSTKQPEQKVIDDYSVWIAENITPVTEAGTDEQPGFTGYEYDLTQYTKDEYIKMIDDRNASLEDQMTQAQEAMCEIYEMMA